MNGATAKAQQQESAGKVESRVRASSSQPAAAGPHGDILELQRSAGNQAVDALSQGQIPHAVQSVVNSGGQPLEPDIRTQMGSRFGHDFREVRIHTDARAADSAKLLNAKAYTVGRDVVFSEGRYSPDAIEGKRLLAHELAHVIQQSRGGSTPKGDIAEGSLEHSAEHAATQVALASGSVAVQGASGIGIARSPEDDKKKNRYSDHDLRALRRVDTEYDQENQNDDIQRSRQREEQRSRKRGRKTEQKRSKIELNIRADQELKDMDARAAKGEFSKLSPREKLKLLNRYEDLVKQAGSLPKQPNLRKGTFWENVSTSPAGQKKQVIFVGGGESLYPQEIDPRRHRHTRTDRIVDTKNPFGKAGPGAENKKSDSIHLMSPREASTRAEEYLIQAHKNAASLPDGMPIVITFARTPTDVDVRKAIINKLFQEGSPVTEVRFGTTVVRKPPEQAGPVVMSEDLQAKARRRSQQRRRREKGGGTEPAGSRSLRKSSRGAATYSATAHSYQRYPVPNPEVLKARSGSLGGRIATPPAPSEKVQVPENAPTAPKPPAPTEAQAAPAKNPKSSASGTSSPLNKPTSPTKGSAQEPSEAGGDVAVATKPETTTSKKPTATKGTDTKKTTGTSTPDHGLTYRKSDQEEQRRFKAQERLPAIKQERPVIDKPPYVSEPKHPLSTPKPTFPPVKASPPPASSLTPPAKASAPRAAGAASSKLPLVVQSISPTAAQPPSPKPATAAAAVPTSSPLQHQGESTTVTPAPLSPRPAAAPPPAPLAAQSHEEIPTASPVPLLPKPAAAPKANVLQSQPLQPIPAAAGPNPPSAPAKATPPRGATKALGTANTALGAVQDYQQRKARGDSTDKAVLGAAVTTTANLRGGTLAAVVNFSNNLEANLAAGQGKGEATASALGGVAGSEIANRVAPSGPVSMAVNMVNTGLQVAGAPKPVTDVTQTAADVVPANFIATIGTQGARAWQNVLTGDTKAIDRQAKEMIEGKAGMPLEGYARSVDIAADLAYSTFSGDKNAKDAEQIFLRQKFSGSEKNLWYVVGGDRVLQKIKFVENLTKGKSVKEAYDDANQQFHDSLQDDVEKWAAMEATQFVKKDLPEAAEFLKKDLQRAKSGASQALSGVKTAASQGVQDAQQRASQAVSEVKQSASDAYQRAKRRVSDTVTQTRQSANNFVKDAKEAAAHAVDQTKEVLEKRVGEARNLAAEKLTELRSAADQKVANLKDAAKKRFSSLFD